MKLFVLAGAAVLVGSLGGCATQPRPISCYDVSSQLQQDEDAFYRNQINFFSGKKFDKDARRKELEASCIKPKESTPPKSSNILPY